MHDPQHLSTFGKIQALIALGRIPLASEVPFWTIFGCILAWRTFPSDDPASSFNFLAALQCTLVTWGTNVSINYGNEYFDWAMDRPGQLASIRRDMANKSATKAIDHTEKIGEVEKDPLPSLIPTRTTLDTPHVDMNEPILEKIWHNSSRCLHDGTFSPYIALVISLSIQALTLLLILFSRHFDHTLNPSSNSTMITPFQGSPLIIVLFGMVMSQEYVGPPLRLHYNGWGEITSCFFLTIVSVTWGYAGYYTSSHPLHIISATDFFRPPSGGIFGIDKTMWNMLGAMVLTEAGRILVMHIHDIEADKLGGKITLVVRLGYKSSARLSLLLSFMAEIFWAKSMRMLWRGEGAMIGDISQSGSTEYNSVGKFWAVGAGVILAYSVVMSYVTMFSLFGTYHTLPPPRLLASITVSIQTLAKLVSLQVISIPIIMSIAAVIAGKA